MTRARGSIAIGVAIAAALVALAGADAGVADVFEPISLASVGMREGATVAEQAEVAQHPALSGDGRYVAFDGSFGGVAGVWRAELVPGADGQLHGGAIEQVAGGDAQLPSISADGRFVSFTTNEGATLPAITNGARDDHPQREAVNVYVRDMSRRPGDAGAFVVASARSGSDQPLAYSGGGFEQSFGSVAAGRSALSADGRYLAFVTTAESDLAGEHTPALQVAVRDLLTQQTRLVSVEYEGGVTGRPVATVTEGGRTVGAVAGTNPFPASAGAALSQGASISADGSTVAWLGQELAKQTPVAGNAEASPGYTEPLWRRIAGGPLEPTRRITGGADPTSPACAASGESEPARPPTLSDPCQGPFEASLPQGGAGVFAAPSVADNLPRLSANGTVVAFLASQRYIAGGEEFNSAENSDDLYVADMDGGLTRVQALRRLTLLASGNANIGGGAAAISDIGVSPAGTQIAFSTRRTAFPLGSPAFVSVAQANAGMEEVYSIDLANDTLTRVTHGYQGEAQQSEAPGPLISQSEAGSPSYSQDGEILSFSSGADNLVYGEGNRANSAFIVERKRFLDEAVTQYISPPPSTASLSRRWVLGARARSRRDGTVVVEALVPGAGRLAASAASELRVAGGRARGRGVPRSRRRRNTARKTRAGGAPLVATRLVATAGRAAAGEGALTLRLVLRPHYRRLSGIPGGLSARLALSFASSGHPLLRQRLAITFQRAAHKKRARTRGSRRGRA